MKTAPTAATAVARRKRIFRARRRNDLRRWVRTALLLLLAAWVGMAVWHRYKPLPDGLSVATPMRAPDHVRFLADYTWTDAAGERHVDQQIFPRVLDLIAQAERLIVMDMFLYNHFAGETGGDDMRPLSLEVTDAMVRRMAVRPGLRAILITDPINGFYGSLDLPQFERLRDAGVEVVITDLNKLRASNPAWSGFWRLCCQWFGPTSDGGWLPNPVGDQEVTLRSVFRLLNFKANHRKTLVVDSRDTWIGMVTSGNAHDASSAHSNIAVEFSGAAALDLLATERVVAAFSAPGLDWPELQPPLESAADANGARMQVLTEAEIRDGVIAMLDASGAGDSIDLAMFYISHRGIVEGLVAARARGAEVRALLDPNKDAFGRQKGGIPNRSVAAELVEAGIEVRWCDTHGEQCHDKLILARRADGGSELIAGSANFTRRNLDDLNLETNVRVTAPVDSELMRHTASYFERRWAEPGVRNYSVPYSAYAAEGWIQYWRYRFMEFTGLSTF
ncbi:MAG TPA: phospholipase D family protein [Wenzhouxiangellaceae bacterium]|nr:phospholipase D family protein [Wenzhouxiangellaceae bacterium]